MRESSTTQQMWLAVMMMMVEVTANYVHCTLYVQPRQQLGGEGPEGTIGNAQHG